MRRNGAEVVKKKIGLTRLSASYLEVSYESWSFVASGCNIFSNKISSNSISQLPSHLPRHQIRNLSPKSQFKTWFIMAITKIHARSIYDFRAQPRHQGWCYSGGCASPGYRPLWRFHMPYEAIELRDRYKAVARKGFHQSLVNVNEIIGPAVIKANNNTRD